MKEMHCRHYRLLRILNLIHKDSDGDSLTFGITAVMNSPIELVVGYPSNMDIAWKENNLNREKDTIIHEISI